MGDVESKAAAESAQWHSIYPEYADHVRLVTLVNCPALMMPHFATPRRAADVVDGVKKLERPYADSMLAISSMRMSGGETLVCVPMERLCCMIWATLYRKMSTSTGVKLRTRVHP